MLVFGYRRFIEVMLELLNMLPNFVRYDKLTRSFHFRF